ncbi:MAG: hypothetical protein ACJA1A_000844 [Saprospiraceae bacterium]|jgi:hypothetical protein|tara:strand:- start:1237 stop:2730 length:1494 start_codon:yes stop_codon:yes gene_type:complete
MKKNIAYYLEDPERLSEISLHELNKWVEEMPYSQPLRLLVDMKSEKFVSANESNTNYGAYFAEDYEPLTKKATKKLAKLNIKKSTKEDRLVPGISNSDDKALDEEVTEVTEVADVFEVTEVVEIEEIEEAEEVGEITLQEKSTIAHSLVDDVSEDIVEDDVLETNPNMVLVNEISHESADEVLEDQLENEVLEISLANVDEVTSFKELDTLMESGEVEENLHKDQNAGIVDYKSFVVGVAGDKISTEEIETEIQDEKVIDKEEIFGPDDLVDAPKKSKKKKKSKKSVKGDKEKKAVKKELKSKEEKKKKKSNGKNSKKLKAKNKRKNKSEKSKSEKKEKSTIKKIKGEIIKTDSSSSPKPVKGKAKKIKKKVKYVVVNEVTTNDFKLKDYEGVSNFTNWLLEQKSINGNQKIEEKKIEISAAKKKGKKKKKNKKNKVPQVAQNSVKKSEMILSEPLANIMAAQGHTKKASKMYKQLGLIFPEKSGYFAAKIENLKNK